MMYELIVFDWDGTLMDSEARIVACLQAAAADIEEPSPSRESAKEVIGLGLPEAMQHLFPLAEAQTHSRLIESYRRHFLGDSLAPSILFNSTRTVLEGLANTDRFLAIATGKSRRGLDKVLSETGLGEYFHATRCADEAFSKPHPQMLQEIMTQLGVAAAQTLMIGDTEFDMQMAANADVDAVGVSYGVHSCARLAATGALHCLADLAELPGWLNRPTLAV